MSERRLFVDIQTIQSVHFGDRGIPRFASEVSRALLAHDAPVAALALNPLFPWPERLHPDLARAPQLTWNTAGAFRRARADGPLAYVVISPFEVGRPVQGVLPPHVAGVPEVVMVHDLIPELVGTYDPETDWGRVYSLRRRWARAADLLLSPSESTRRDLVEHWDVEPERIVVVGEAASTFFRPALPDERPAEIVGADQPAITRPFVLCVSSSDPHKNTAGLIEAWGRLPPSVRADHQLVIVCKLSDDVRRAWTELARRSGLADHDVVVTGFVEDATLRALYQEASLFVLPSQYEGFGLPVLEAAACGCPAITSNTSSLPEILDWPDATFTPTDADAIALAIERALTDSTYRAELSEVGRRASARHTWSAVVERLQPAISTLRELRREPPRLRVALVGGSETAAPLADELAARGALDWFTDAPGRDRLRGRRPERVFRLLPASSLGPTFNPASYDAVLVTPGSELAPGVLARTRRIDVDPSGSAPQLAAEICAAAIAPGPALDRPAEAPAPVSSPAG
jgi:glycosyltransferase involved in cell wall biosynthesis